jgi:hypothetical protein
LQDRDEADEPDQNLQETREPIVAHVLVDRVEQDRSDDDDDRNVEQDDAPSNLTPSVCHRMRDAAAKTHRTLARQSAQRVGCNKRKRIAPSVIITAQ